MSAPPPSSFDQDVDFYEESRWQKLRRRLLEEPLIPLGCALTCWALFEASKSMKTGDKHRTNRMFRRRIYAQGFTILAMLAGSAYWETDRAKRRQYDELSEEKKRKDKHEQWIKELEVREEEEQEMRKIRREMMRGSAPAEKEASENQSKNIRSVLEATESRSGFRITTQALEAIGGRWR
ncbi:Respiratory supercomplex factor 1, mitochondrial [Sphaceloma murrayae]|uniref:Respiratory supercomplex factor 1, mitochondrial n=1 Tax=Sphaceloma murrayae TaxID=2082308 RepID=A0A2K1R3G5_9PEZI|nr:Respiratory supercomplex factor 1, mitochondrial [Sphaceloma murrayae]